MTHEDFIAIVRNPQNVNADYAGELKDLVERFPYFSAPRLLLARIYNDTNNILCTPYLTETTLYCSSRSEFYNYIYADKKEEVVPVQFNRTSKISGNYFDIIQNIENEGGDTNQSLKLLAKKLKEARELVVKIPAKTVVKTKEAVELKPDPVNLDYFNVDINVKESQVSELNARRLISEHKYNEAIKILKALNLNNPKKSVYFADQIRFLEKVITNSKK